MTQRLPAGAFHEYDLIASQELLDAQNARAREIQAATGVNPDQCMTLLGLPGANYAPGTVFLRRISNKQFPTPLVGQNRDHDGRLHDERIKMMHPELVAVCARFATLACSDILPPTIQSRDAAITHIDLFTARVTLIDHRMPLAVMLHALPDISSTPQELLDLQWEHEQAMRAVEVTA